MLTTPLKPRAALGLRGGRIEVNGTLGYCRGVMEKILREHSKHFILATVGVLIAVAIFFIPGDEDEHKVIIDETVTATSSVEIMPGVDADITQSENIPKRKWSLERTLSYPDIYTLEAIQIHADQVDAVKKIIEENPGNVDAYINLGVLWKMADDYDGAILAWEYAKEMSPTYYSPYQNLGNLYLYDLKDNALSETNLREAVRLNPQLIDAWKSLHDLYRYEMARPIQAEEALTDALQANPNHLDLVLSLARYYKEIGEIEKSRSAYIDALAIAEREAAQEDVPTLIREELESLE